MCLIPIILRFIELFLFRDVSGNYVTVVLCCGRLVDYVFCFHLHSSSFSRAKSFFVWEGEYLCFAVCFVITFSNLYLLSEVISVRLDTHFFSSRFSDITIWSDGETAPAVSCNSLVVVDYFLWFASNMF